MKKHLYIIVILFAIGFSACEKVVDLNLEPGRPIPYLDAWITDQPGVQTIKFLEAVNYLEDAAPRPISNAQVQVTDLTLNQQYDFTYQDGVYRFDPGAGARLGITGHIYQLKVTYQGKTFTATDTLKRVTTVDSITYEFRKESGPEKEGYYAEFFATDIAGATDYSWIRAYKNGQRNQFAYEMVAVDGSYEEGLADGFLYIPPFREGINSMLHPYQKGDEVKVVLRSLSKPSYGFIRQVLYQLANGGLFSRILENVPSNIKNQEPGSDLKIYGWFGTVAEASRSVVIE